MQSIQTQKQHIQRKINNMISAKVIQASRNKYTGKLIYTFELDYSRMIHSELMTHREFSRNAQSSRAVPVPKTLEINKEWVRPLVWAKNQPGMSSTEELEGIALESVKALWDASAKSAFAYSKAMADAGLHKQYANRQTEGVSRIKVVVTSTEFDNFFWLRDDPDAAQPEVVALARAMQDAMADAEVLTIGEDDWHVPYITRKINEDGCIIYLDAEFNELTKEDAIKISASCCAQVSYRNLNETKEKALEIYDRLFSGAKPHLSPVEHQACAIDGPNEIGHGEWTKGITHRTRNGTYCSGNFKEFVQYRQLLS